LQCQWLTPVILATEEADIRRIVVQVQLGQIVCETLLKIPNTNQGWQGTLSDRTLSFLASMGPEFKPQYWEKIVVAPN
jgi:hypothetical protein